MAYLLQIESKANGFISPQTNSHTRSIGLKKLLLKPLSTWTTSLKQKNWAQSYQPVMQQRPLLKRWPFIKSGYSLTALPKSLKQLRQLLRLCCKKQSSKANLLVVPLEKFPELRPHLTLKHSRARIPNFMPSF